MLLGLLSTILYGLIVHLGFVLIFAIIATINTRRQNHESITYIHIYSLLFISKKSNLGGVQSYKHAHLSQLDALIESCISQVGGYGTIHLCSAEEGTPFQIPYTWYPFAAWNLQWSIQRL